MTYQDIHTFLTIASSSSLSKAAESLFVSQPALSHRLSALEEELGTELIIRRKGSRTLELTDAGQRFVPIARKWEQLWIETGKIKFERPSTQLRIVNVDSLNFYFMPQVIENFLRVIQNVVCISTPCSQIFLINLSKIKKQILADHQSPFLQKGSDNPTF